MIKYYKIYLQELINFKILLILILNQKYYTLFDLSKILSFNSDNLIF